MPSGFTSYFVQKAAAHLFSGDTSWTPPSTYYWVPYKGEPTDLGTSNQSVLTTRVAMAFGAADATGLVTLTGDLSYAETAPEQIAYMGGWDLATGGHCCVIKELDQSKNYYSGDTIVVPKFSIQMPPGEDLNDAAFLASLQAS